MRAVIYCRISRDRAGESLGVQRQEAECRELCERSSWSVVDVLTDNDVSAYSGKKRPGYESLLELIRSGRVDVVVAWNTDRLHRRLGELVAYTEVCSPRNVTTHTVRTGPIDLSTPSGILVAQQLGAVAEYESRNRSARVKAAKDQRAASGVWSGGPRPFGWESDGVTPRESEVVLIRDATRAVLRGESVYSVTQKWRSDGVLTTYGKPMYVAAVRSILLRARNAGLREHRGVVAGVAVWDPIVDAEDWHACRRILTDPSRKLTWSTKPKYFGAMRYRCGAPLPDGSECGFPLKVNGSQATKVYRSKQGAKYRYRNYVCTRDPKLGVPHVSARQERVDEYVTGRLIAGMLEQGFAPHTDVGGDSSGSSAVDVAEIEAAQAALATELAEGRLPAAAFAAANAQLAARLQEAQADESSGVISRAESEALRGFERDPHGVFDALPLELKRALLERYVTVTVLPASSRSPLAGPVENRIRLDWHFDSIE